MNEHDREELRALLREAMPAGRPELESDLWPRMLRALDHRPARLGWLDWALLAGALSWCAAFPAAMGALLYQL